MASKAELEARVDVLERRFAILENRVRSLSRAAEPSVVDADEQDRVRLKHIHRILRSLGGTASLDQIASENNTITKAGTRAQLVRLIEIGDVEQPSRGMYRLKRR